MLLVDKYVADIVFINEMQSVLRIGTLWARVLGDRSMLSSGENKIVKTFKYYHY